MDGQTHITIAVLGDERCDKEDLLFSFAGLTNPSVARSDDGRYATNCFVDGRAVSLCLCAPAAELYTSRSPSPQPPGDGSAGGEQKHHHRLHKLHFHLPHLRRRHSKEKNAPPGESPPEVTPSQSPVPQEWSESAEAAETISADSMSASGAPALVAPPADVFLVVFSVSEPSTAEAAAKIARGLARSRDSCEAPIVLAAVNIHKREGAAVERCLDRNQREPLDFAEGVAMAREAGAVAYEECSAATNAGVRSCFESCVRAALSPDRLVTPRSLENVNRAVVLWVTQDASTPVDVTLPGIGGRSFALEGEAELAAWLHRYGHCLVGRIIVMCEGIDDSLAAYGTVQQWISVEYQKNKRKKEEPVHLVVISRGEGEHEMMHHELCGHPGDKMISVTLCSSPQEASPNLFIPLE